MKLFPTVAGVRNWLAGKIAVNPQIRGGYDAAATTIENQNHWANTDSLHPNALLDPGTRQTLRDRSRYEATNNSYYRGLLHTLVTDTIGSGPRLQLRIPGDTDRTAARAIERAWKRWSKAINFAKKMRLLHRAKIRDGEGFSLIIDNPKLASKLNRITLDLRLYESDQCTDPFDFRFDPTYMDGLKVDDLGNPEWYRLLRGHPGGVWQFRTWETTQIDARYMFHWSHVERAGQLRGEPPFLSALPLFSQLRRFTLAVLGNAEFAANIAGVLESNIPGDYDGNPGVETMDRVPIARNSLLTLPPGTKANQFKAEQPTTGFRDFSHQILNEIGRSYAIPFNIMAGNSSGYNYSSGRLDHLPYHRIIWTDREQIATEILDPLFANHWVDEAALSGAIPASLPPVELWDWEWFWDGFDLIDPVKETSASAQALATKQKTFSEHFAERGLNWREQFEQMAEEQAFAKKLAVTLPTVTEELEEEPEPIEVPQPA